MIPIRKIASLARLIINEEDFYLEFDIKRFLTWIKKLEEVKTDGTDPLISLHVDKIVKKDSLVNDEISLSYIFSNSPENEYDMFVVPRMKPSKHE